MKTVIKIILGTIVISLIISIIFGIVILLGFVPELLGIDVFKHCVEPSGSFVIDLFIDKWMGGVMTFLILAVSSLFILLGYEIVENTLFKKDI
jgi:hypothetical protein